MILLLNSVFFSKLFMASTYTQPTTYEMWYHGPNDDDDEIFNQEQKNRNLWRNIKDETFNVLEIANFCYS